MSSKKSPLEIATEYAKRDEQAKATGVLDAFDRAVQSILDVIETVGGDDCAIESEVLVNVCEARSHWIAGTTLSTSPAKTELN